MQEIPDRCRSVRLRSFIRSRGTACRARRKNLLGLSHSWRYSKLNAEAKTLVAAQSVDGACLLVTRSGTACRAPTGEAAGTKERVLWCFRCGVTFAAIGLGHTQECLCYWESSANWSWRKLVRSL